MAVYFTIDGKRYANVERYTIGEARDLKRISGMLPGEVGEAFGAGDPDAFAALLYLAIRRVNPRFTEADLNKLNLSDVGVDADEVEQEADPVPPAEAGTAPASI